MYVCMYVCTPRRDSNPRSAEPIFGLIFCHRLMEKIVKQLQCIEKLWTKINGTKNVFLLASKVPTVKMSTSKLYVGKKCRHNLVT
jgi:hypothetical protein